MEKKLTKKEMFTLISNLLANREDIVDFCNHEIELLEKKKSNGNKKANETISASIETVYNALVEMNKPMTVSELIANADLTSLKNELNIVSTQKVSAYLNKLVDCGKVVKFTEKKKPYFKVAETE